MIACNMLHQIILAITPLGINFEAPRKRHGNSEADQTSSQETRPPSVAATVPRGFRGDSILKCSRDESVPNPIHGVCQITRNRR